ncbi:hypothetical protein V6R21_23615 [Limibacter armeniacum]|uniref:hypothetical protein n=1 Tax=Limibacter armeniacum TaxID=466084 RepID=UPI002FE6329D
MKNIHSTDLFSREHTLAQQLFDFDLAWEAIPQISEILQSLIPHLPDDYQEIQPDVWVGSGTTIGNYVTIQGPAIIGRNCELRHCAFLRNDVIIGDDVVVGNSTEIKNAILFDGVQAPHFNYIGDSILGYKAHIGAGVILSNFRSIAGTVKVVLADGQKADTGLVKFGALLGDQVEVGAQTVLNPGAIIGRESMIYPLVNFRGTLDSKMIYKEGGQVVAKV